jgi:hypothetical protein
MLASVLVRRNAHSVGLEKPTTFLQVLECWFSCYLWEAGVRESHDKFIRCRRHGSSSWEG